MVGIIVTGHGSFATGLGSALEFISGKQESCVFVDFTGNEESYHHCISKALDELSACEEIVFLCDLKGGTPFKYASMLSLSPDNRYTVVYGANLPLLIEAATARDEQTSPDAYALVDETVSLAKSQLGVFSMPASVEDED